MQHDSAVSLGVKMKAILDKVPRLMFDDRHKCFIYDYCHQGGWKAGSVVNQYPLKLPL